MMYGKPNRVQYTNLYNLLMDNDRFTRIHVPVVDESTQADGHGILGFLFFFLFLSFSLSTQKST